MCPIEIIPGVPSHISADLKTLRQAEPTTEPKVAESRLYVVPVDKDDTYIVNVDGWFHQAGGILSTKRLTPEDKEGCIMLTTADDPSSSYLLGLTSLTIDNILYEAKNATAGES